jgi:hypothetical protein
MATSSPYPLLVNLCYQLRHENEELMETVSWKSSLVDEYENEVRLLKSRIQELEDKHRSEAEHSLTEHMDLSNERLRFMEENMRLDSRNRELETRVKTLESQLESRNEQVEILLNQLESPPQENNIVEMATGPPTSQLERDNARLRRNFEEVCALVAAINNKRPRREEVPDETFRRGATPEPVLQISQDDSLLRLMERMVGFSIVRSEKSVTLVSDSGTTVRFRLDPSNNEISLLSSEGIDAGSLAVLKSYNSIPGFLAKLNLMDLTRKTLEI